MNPRGWPFGGSSLFAGTCWYACFGATSMGRSCAKPGNLRRRHSNCSCATISLFGGTLSSPSVPALLGPAGFPLMGTAGTLPPSRALKALQCLL